VPTPPGRYDHGEIRFDGVDLLKHSEKQMQTIRGNQIAMIFQEPMTSLNPVYTIGDQILEAVLLHQKVSHAAAVQIAEQALRDVGIGDPGRRLKEYPHQLSGGMRQRVMIAMALACKPRLLLADEPTTALDVTIQAQILELLRKLQVEHGMSIMLITHDLGVVAENADVVAVMYAGRVVEYGSVHDVFNDPRHPYTRGLFASMPRLGESHRRLTTIPGQVPNPARLPSGCPFHPRCGLTRECAAKSPAGQTVELTFRRDAEVETERVMQKCVQENPPLMEVAPGHWAACFFTEGYQTAKPTKPDVTYRRADERAAV
jgi:oligopeptide/dipeptide ABC transporter ATP-binding protein